MEDLEEILDKFVGRIYRDSEDKDHIVQAVVKRENFEEAKQALKQLIVEREREARIEERTRIQSFLHGLLIAPQDRRMFDVLSRNNHERLAQLKQLKKEG